jgi:hypothetical protein
MRGNIRRRRHGGAGQQHGSKQRIFYKFHIRDT